MRTILLNAFELRLDLPEVDQAIITSQRIYLNQAPDVSRLEEPGCGRSLHHRAVGLVQASYLGFGGTKRHAPLLRLRFQGGDVHRCGRRRRPASGWARRSS
jgi:hypothetical protein